MDSERLMHQFEVLGYRVRHDSEMPNGDIIIVNTCGFIGDAKEESIETILNLAQLKKKNQSKLFVMGCLSERYLSNLETELPEVDKFYGKFNYLNILNDLGLQLRADVKLERTLTTPSHYAYIKISEGCNRTCSYCAIPIITGKHRSRKMEDVVKEVELLVQKGVKEFQLIAQDLSFYGIDRYKAHKLPELVERISDIKGVEWIRLHYAYPAHFPFDLLRVMRERKNVCNYLDLALQHISNPMLKKMRRNIGKVETYDLLRKIREEVPGIHLRTTLLIGHPDETEQDFEELKQFVKDIRFERLGAFAYSHEDGTYAYKNYSDNIPEVVKQQRLDEIMALQQEIAHDINKGKKGKIFQVIIDRKEDEFFVGRTEFDSPEVDPEVLIPMEDNVQLELGNFYPIRITNASEFELYGEIFKHKKQV